MQAKTKGKAKAGKQAATKKHKVHHRKLKKHHQRHKKHVAKVCGGGAGAG